MLFEQNLAGVYRSNFEGKILDCNDAFIKMYGYSTKDEVLKISAKELYLNKKERKYFLEILKEKGPLLNYESMGKKKDGSIIWMAENVQLIGGSIFQGTIIDITEKKESDKKILQLSRGLEQSPAMVTITDTDGIITYINPKVTEITGYTAEELLGKNVNILQSGQTSKETYEELWDTILQGKVWKGELLNKKKNGELYWDSETIAPIIDKEGNIINFIAIREDITERKQTEEKLQKAHKKLKSSIDNMPNAYILCDTETLVLEWNRAAEKIFGYSKEEMLGKDLIEFIVPEKVRHLVRKAINKIKVGNVADYSEKDNNIRKDGNLISCQWFNTPLIDENSKVFGFLFMAQDVTKQLHTENMIRESEQRLSSHLKNTPLAAIFWDVDFKVTDWNKSAEKMFGYSKKEALGKYANQLIVPMDIQGKIDDVFNNLLAQTGGEKSTNENITKEGKSIICDWYNIATTDINGEVTGVASLIDNITIRKRNLDELKKTEIKFKLLLENLPSAVLLTKLGGVNAGEIIYANPAAAKQTGYKKSELIGMNIIYDFSVEQISKLLKGKREDNLINDKILSFTEKKKRADGSVYITQVMIAPIEYENEKVTLSVNTDITEQVEAQEKIETSESKYRTLFEYNLAGVYVSTISGKILDCNEAFASIMGYSSKEEVLKTDAANFHENKKEREFFIQNLRAKKELLNFESKPKKKDGSFINVIENVQLIEENILQGTIVEITQLKRTEEELIKAKEKAEESSRIKSIFLANMSHELRTPMIGIIGFTEILKEEIEKPELKEYASFIHEAGNRLMETLNLILTLTKIEAEKVKIELSKIDIIKNIKNTMLTFDKMAANKSIYLKFKSPIEQLETETDERMFDQIISNLVNNAVKFTEKGEVTVSVNKVKNDSYLEIKVKDTGIGIPKDKQEVIWEEFRQACEGETRTFEGTGLGLTITNYFVCQLGGEIKLESELGKGATFNVLLPIREKTVH